MGFKLSPESKVGLFAFIAIAVAVYLTLRVGDFKYTGAGTYRIYLMMDSAEGLDKKTPVSVAGIQVGVVEDIELLPDNKARLRLKIREGVVLPRDVVAEVHTKGVLGDVFLELVPGQSPTPIREGETIIRVSPTANFSEVAKNLNEVAVNLKSITKSLEGYVGGDEAVMTKIMKNTEILTRNMAGFSERNRANMDQVVQNLKELTQTLNQIANKSEASVQESILRIENITRTIEEGKGTVGKLIKDPSTAEKLDEALDNVNNLVGGANRLEVELGYHLEYLGNTNDVKHYVGLTLKPRPDKFFILEFVSDPDPSPTRTNTTTDVITPGGRTTVVTEREETDRNKFRLSAMLAKKFYDFTLRAGMIESTGGVGLDYNRGPFGLQFSAFDFSNGDRDRPHLKFMGTFNVTSGLYLLGGVDDPISKRHGPDWFVGAGIRFLDDDIKSLLGIFSARP